MRGHLHLLASLDEFLRVISLIRTHRDFDTIIIKRLPCIVKHDLGRFAFGVSVSACNARVDDQTVMVVTERVAHVAQFTRSLPLAIESRFRISLGLMRLVAAFATLEVGLVVAALVVLIVTILAYETLVSRPCLNQAYRPR
jgi:hypothetical protein